MLGQVRTLLEMIRFSHTLFALPFALLSAALAWRAQGYFSWLQLLGILLCMVFARSAAMAFNRLADRDIDAQNPRTAQRHLPAGALTPVTVWLFAIVCAAGFFAATWLFLLEEPRNPWPLYLAAPVLGFVRERLGLEAREAYGTFNMGAGFALYVARADVARTLAAAQAVGLRAWDAGTVEAGSKEVVIEPLELVQGAVEDE